MTKLRYVTEKSAVLVFTPENRRYLTGFPSSLGYLLMTSKGNRLFVDSRYFEAATKKVTGAEVCPFGNITETLNEAIKASGSQKLLVETEMSLALFEKLKKGLSVKVVPSASLSEKLLNLRSVKKKEETDSIIAAQRIAEKAFDDILSFIKEGVTEKEIAATLEYRMKCHGAEGLAFDTIAVSGANTSLPHGVPTDKRVEKGDFVTMDFGAVVNGYMSDMTRTVAVGFVTDEMQKVYDTVLAANIKAADEIKAGMLCKEADAIARGIITEAGYGAFFGHGLGHGVGLMIHEAPNLSPRAGGAVLRAGQIVTDEPGIYLPGKFGVRIEDMLLVRKNNCKNLTKAPKHLIIL